MGPKLRASTKSVFLNQNFRKRAQNYIFAMFFKKIASSVETKDKLGSLDSLPYPLNNNPVFIKFFGKFGKMSTNTLFFFLENLLLLIVLDPPLERNNMKIVNVETLFCSSLTQKAIFFIRLSRLR